MRRLVHHWLAARKLQTRWRTRSRVAWIRHLKGSAVRIQKVWRGVAARYAANLAKAEEARQKDVELQLLELRRRLEDEMGSSAELLATQQRSYELEINRLRTEALKAKAALEVSERERTRLAADSEATLLSMKMEMSALKKALVATQAQLQTSIETRVLSSLPSPPSALPDQSGSQDEQHSTSHGSSLPPPPVHPPPTTAVAPQPLWNSDRASEHAKPRLRLSALAFASTRTPQEHLLRLLHQSERERDQLRRQRDMHADEARKQCSAVAAARIEADSLRHQVATLGEEHATLRVIPSRSGTYSHSSTHTSKKPAPPSETLQHVASCRTAPALIGRPPSNPQTSSSPSVVLSPGHLTTIKRPGSVLRIGGGTVRQVPTSIPPPPPLAPSVDALVRTLLLGNERLHSEECLVRSGFAGLRSEECLVIEEN